MRQIRILTQVARETFSGMKRSGWSNWLVIGILAMALTIFGGILQLTMTLKNVVDSWGSQLEISAYLKDGYEARMVAKRLSQLPNISLVEIVPKDVAWQDMQSRFRVASLKNPLPDTLHVRLMRADAVESTANAIRKVNGVEHVRYPLKVANSINRFRHFLEIAGLVLTASLTAATLIVIGNTIHLVIQARHREIEILSLMGVSPWYIRSPLVLQGALYGSLSALLAILNLGAVRLYFDSFLREQLVGFMPLFSQNLEYGMQPTFFALLVLGIVVGAGGSAWTSGRYIKI
jgi:cell division transport system permease protein